MILWIIGFSGIAVTVGLHSLTTSMVVYVMRHHALRAHNRFGRRARPYILGLIATCIAAKHLLDIFLWAVAYWVFAGASEFDGFESALYFSAVTYTALGYGDIVLTDSWRLLCGIQAMNGILLFGWSSALIFFLVQNLWRADIGADDSSSVPNKTPL